MTAVQVRYVADNSIRVRAWIAGIPKHTYIVTRQFYSSTAGRWVSEPLSY